jgi:8-amino-7-oxononanoate synthase
MSFEFTQEKLNNQKSKSRYRKRTCVQQTSINTPELHSQIIVDGKEYINFSSNDYLGLNNHPKINQAMQEGIDRFGLCSSSSSLVTGFNYAHQALEDTICQWLNKPKCLLFSSGFAANLAMLQTIGEKDCQFFLDKLSHASMIDGAYSSNAIVKRFSHNNTAQLSTLLSSSKSKNKLIASEGVFSMDGDRAELLKLEDLAIKHNSWLYLDDAHSIGVIGNKGEGSSSILSFDKHPNIIMATLGKAIATSGAFLACDEELHDYLINFARHYIYSTAISPALSWATIKSIELIQKEQWRRDKISELSALLAELLDDTIKIAPSESSIHAIIIGDEKSALNISEELKKQGVWLTAIRPPTVSVGSSRLRVTICADHNRNNIKHLAHCLNEALR